MRWYQLTQNLPLASGNSTDTNGPSLALTEEIASESSSPGDKPLLFTPPVIQLLLAQPTGFFHTGLFGADAAPSNCRDDTGEEGCAKTGWGLKKKREKKDVFRELTTDATVPAPRYSGLNRSKQQRGLCFIFWLTDL